MPFYTCNSCQYSTKLKVDYERHLKTKKHQKNSSNVALCSPNVALCSLNVAFSEKKAKPKKVYCADFTAEAVPANDGEDDAPMDSNDA